MFARLYELDFDKIQDPICRHLLHDYGTFHIILNGHEYNNKDSFIFHKIYIGK